MSLFTGLTMTKKDGINCDDAESVGSKIQQQMDDVVFNEAKIKKASHVKTLEDSKSCVIAAGKQVHIDPAVLMLRCHVVAQRMGEDVESYFQYELTAAPTSLFSDNFMRHGQKSELATELLVVPATPRLSVPETLLVKHFGPSVVIFDG